ncbi:MAG: hypothetical protein ACYDER_26740 [Ktedonobacteraceae bacterium]
MESSEQEPLGENTEQYKDAEVESNVQPLYEFPPEHLHSSNPTIQSSPAAITQVLPLEDAAPVDEEAVRKGLVYPPPPSYYQNMQPLTAPPLLPPVQPQPLQPRYGQMGRPEQSTPVNPGVVPPQTQGQQIPRQPQAQQGFYPPAYPPPFVPPYERRPTMRKSRRWLWITLSIVGAVMLLTCGLCSWAAYNFLAPAVQGVSGSLNVVNDYYGNLQTKNYAAAFGDINTQYELSSLTETKFAQEASARDSQYGPILSFTPGQPAYASTPNGGFDFTRFTISVDVKRAKLSYTTTFYLRKIGSNWKITNFDSV